MLFRRRGTGGRVEIRRIPVSVESYTSGPIVIVTPQGGLDTNRAPEVEKVLTDHIERGEKKIVLDLSCIEYISSIGLRVILKTAMAMTRNGGRMALCGGNDQVLEVLRLSGPMTMSLHTPALADALAKIQA
jgi:anti-anti-sigma factor